MTTQRICTNSRSFPAFVHPHHFRRTPVLAKKTNFAFSPILCLPDDQVGKTQLNCIPKDSLTDTKKHRFGKKNLAKTVLFVISHLTWKSMVEAT